MQIGDTVNLIRKITGEVLAVELREVLSNGSKPAVEVRWKSDRYRYRLDLVKDEVIAIDATQDHRQKMKLWYTISSTHRKELTDLFWSHKKMEGSRATAGRERTRRT